MPWTEFISLISGLMPDTPLGQIVTIRSETDPKVIKKFNPDQKRIHREWRTKQAQEKLNNPEKMSQELEAFTRSLARMFGPKEARKP